MLRIVIASLLLVLLAPAVVLAADDAVVLDDQGELRVSSAGWETDFSISAVPFDEIISGGPPKDGIPAIDEPRFGSVATAREWLDGRSPVIALELAGEARAYPVTGPLAGTELQPRRSSKVSCATPDGEE